MQWGSPALHPSPGGNLLQLEESSMVQEVVDRERRLLKKTTVNTQLGSGLLNSL
jgi:hypothetical protein